MGSCVFQTVSGLHVTRGGTKFSAMLTPVCTYLILAGDTGDPFHPLYKRFLAWASCCWERVWFIAGATEAGHEAQCRLMASKFHNVRFLHRQTDRTVPGLQLLGVSLWPEGAQDSHLAFVQKMACADTIVVSYAAPPPGTAVPHIKWVHGLPSEHSPPNAVCNPYRPPNRWYDHGFYFEVNIKPSTFFFEPGTDSFPPKVSRIAVRLLDNGPPPYMCFYCGQYNHTKAHCPLIQCMNCMQFGHSDRVCTAHPTWHTKVDTQ